MANNIEKWDADLSLQISSTGNYKIVLDAWLVEEIPYKRVICTINKLLTLHAAILYSKNEGYYIYLGKKHFEKLGVPLNSTISVIITKDYTPFQFEFPESLQAALSQDEEAEKIFLSLTDGKKRSLAYLIQQVKSTDKQIERSLKILDNLKSGVRDVKMILK